MTSSEFQSQVSQVKVNFDLDLDFNSEEMEWNGEMVLIHKASNKELEVRFDTYYGEWVVMGLKYPFMNFRGSGSTLGKALDTARNNYMQADLY